MDMKDGTNLHAAQAKEVLRSISFLIRWSSHGGAKPVSGLVAAGLAGLIEECSVVRTQPARGKKHGRRKREIDELHRLFGLNEQRKEPDKGKEK